MTVTRHIIRATVANFAILSLLIMPLCMVANWIETTISLGRGGELGYQVSSLAVLYLMIIGFVLAGALIYQVALSLIPTRLRPGQRRMIALLLSPIVPSLLIAFSGGAVFYMMPVSLPLSTLLYGLTARIPTGEDQGRLR